jgi:rhodanese-related sulfurtransferase
MPVRRVIVYWGVLVAAAVLLAGCAAQEPAASTPPPAGAVAPASLPKNSSGYVDISPQQLAAMLEKKDFTLVNVHVPYEGEIEKTDLFIPYDQIEGNLDKLGAKDKPIVLYCRSGSMSTTAAEELARLGYSHVYELDGGFNAWKAAGYPLLDKGK